MADERPIIIKRIKKSGGGHHGGAWKVAYADFVTAMMAFFLLLWLLGNTTDEQKKAIGNYFSPTLAMSSSSTTVAVMDGQPQVMETTAGGAAAEVDVEEDGTGQTGDGTGNSDQEQAASATSQGEKPIDEQQAEKALQAAETKRFEEVKQQIKQVIDQSPDLSGLKDNLQIDQTPEGLRIQLLDKEKESMFSSGSADMAEKSRKLLSLVAQAVKGLPNKLAISGHTDATPYVGTDGRSNWELSSDRANAARRVLVQNGVDPAHVRNVVGRADTDPFIKENPSDPQNRRISIVLLSEVHPASSEQGNAAPTPASAAPAEPAAPPAEIIPPSGAEGEASH
ncbi:flagellar motor protein MotB [Dongia rigui]|uniref:Flagellar motor protein MotB n=1 Tax=Dongia rigui TaxID=940149 RepID=A0ABU5E1H3_9PROT|nr:flagellar motor protein MotB [Dongia rigui]MDY0873050.1 flagellar motor protein MotB [Dongia rigui]